MSLQHYLHADGKNATPVSAANPLPVSATVNANATVTGFTPNGSVASLSVTNSTGNVALPTGTVVLVTNTGSTNIAYIKLSVGAGTATTSDMALVAGASVGLTVGSNTYINAITSSSTTTLRITGGAGLVSGFGGGGSSGGGGGGAVTIADGDSATLGAKADAKSTATDTTAVTLMQVTKQISASAQATAASVAGTLTVGSHAVTNAGTFAVQPAGSVAHDAVGTGVSPVLEGGYASAAAPTDVSADGDAVRAWRLRNGAAAVNITAAGALIPGDATNGLKVQVTAATGIAQGAAISGVTLSPIAGESLSTTPTRTTAQVDIPVMNLAGSLCVQPYGLPDNYVSGLTAAMTGTTSTAVTGIGAGGSGNFNYITQLTVGNSHATVGTFVELQDGSGGTTFYTVPAAAVYGGAVITFNPPLKQPTANTALYCKNTTTGANVIVSANGYKGK